MMVYRPENINLDDEPESLAREWVDAQSRGAKVFPAVPFKAIPVVPSQPIIDGRVCIFDDDLEMATDVAEVLEALGHQVMVINEMIGASNRIRAFSPEILVIDAANTTLPGPKLIEVLRRNLGELPRIVFFTELPHASLRDLGLGDYDWLPKSRGLLTLVNRIRVLLMYGQAERQDRVPRA